MRMLESDHQGREKAVTGKSEAHPKSILLVEDEKEMADEIRSELEGRGYLVRPASIAEAADAARVGDVAMIIMDRIVFGEDSLVALAGLRKEGVKVPVLVISALSSIDEKVKGLKAGGDDYLTKPFAMVELVARVEAMLRRLDDVHHEIARRRPRNGSHRKDGLSR